jgi:hypothetical protein
MPDLIRHYDNQNQAIIDAGSALLALSYFNLIHLTGGGEFA